jgi:hypothetical protein
VRSVSSTNSGTGITSFLPSASVAVNESLTPAINPTGASASAVNNGATQRTVTLSVACLKK